MKLYDGQKIICGLIVFLGLVTLPLWHNAVTGKAAYAPKPKIPTEEKECVESRAAMRIGHKALLEDWKESAVRKATRLYVSGTKKTYEISLNRTCMKCHRDKSEFCDRCHNYVGVTNKCWDCHSFPKELEKG